MATNIDAIGALRANWLWFAVLGVLLVVAGMVALGSLVTATVITVWLIGVMMIVGGAVEVLHGLKAQAWGRFLWSMVSGALYIAGGLFAIVDPFLASAAITLLIGLALIAGGVFRIMLGVHLRHIEDWVWVVLGGMVTLLCGVLIAARWPLSSLWVIGALLGIDLVLHGATWIQFGLALRARR